MSEMTSTHRWFHRLAWLTVVVAVLPIFLGAMTTTENAGMAFPDWPTSDDQGMFAYPWFKLVDSIWTDRDSYEKFLEHGHRLAGIVIGLSAIALFIVGWLPGSNGTLGLLGSGVLMAVIAQGLLGGLRVLENMPQLAMLHGLFASLVFSLMCVTATVSSERWRTWQPNEENHSVTAAKWAAIVYFCFLLVQYSLGGMIRHPVGTRSPVYEHLGFGLLALFAVHAVLYFVIKTKIGWLRTVMRILIGLTAIQVGLGLWAYAMKFGVSSLGLVAVSGSAAQVISRTGHMMTGVFVVGAAVVLMTRAIRVSYIMNSNPQVEQSTAVEA